MYIYIYIYVCVCYKYYIVNIFAACIIPICVAHWHLVLAGEEARMKMSKHGHGLKVALPSKYWTSSLAPARCFDNVVHALCKQ